FKAHELISKIEKKSHATEIHRVLAKFITLHFYDDALELIHQLPVLSPHRNRLLRRMVREQVKEKLFQTALQTTTQFSRWRLPRRALMQNEITLAHLADNLDQAKTEFHDNHNPTLAKDLLLRAVLTATRIPQGYQRYSHLGTIAYFQGKYGFTDDAALTNRLSRKLTRWGTIRAATSAGITVAAIGGLILAAITVGAINLPFESTNLIVVAPKQSAMMGPLMGFMNLLSLATSRGRAQKWRSQIGNQIKEKGFLVGPFGFEPSQNLQSMTPQAKKLLSTMLDVTDEGAIPVVGLRGEVDSVQRIAKAQKIGTDTFWFYQQQREKALFAMAGLSGLDDIQTFSARPQIVLTSNPKFTRNDDRTTPSKEDAKNFDFFEYNHPDDLMEIHYV
ncbi:hypothetical protein BVX98_03115, partial [bacterium F11]